MTVNAPMASGRPMRLKPLYRELTQSPPLPQQGGEEAAEQEEHGHTEPVDREEREGVDAGDLGGVPLGRVRLRPFAGHEEEGRVQDYAQQHGKGAQGVQFVEPATWDLYRAIGNAGAPLP